MSQVRMNKKIKFYNSKQIFIESLYKKNIQMSEWCHQYKLVKSGKCHKGIVHHQTVLTHFGLQIFSH